MLRAVSIGTEGRNGLPNETLSEWIIIFCFLASLLVVKLFKDSLCEILL